MMLKFIFGRPPKKVSTVDNYDLRNLLLTRKHVTKSIRILKGIAANLNVTAIAHSNAKDPQGKKADSIDPDEIYALLLELQTAEHVIDTRLGALYLETGNNLILDNEFFDLKFMVISVINTFSNAPNDKEVSIEKVITKDIASVHSDGEKIRFILMTILRLGFYYAANNTKLRITTFKHDQYFCFYVSVVIEASLVKLTEGPFSYQTIKQDHNANLQNAITLTEKYTEFIGGRLDLVDAAEEKSNHEIKFIVELSLYNS